MKLKTHREVRRVLRSRLGQLVLAVVRPELVAARHAGALDRHSRNERVLTRSDRTSGYSPAAVEPTLPAALWRHGRRTDEVLGPADAALRYRRGHDERACICV